jgi:hypothetical protein
MKLHSGLIVAALLSLGLSSYSCVNGDTVTGGATGGTNGSTGGTNNTGGTSPGTGGTHTGGTTGTGGIVTSTGGTTHTGGTTGTGGTHTGGTTGTGGIVSTGGVTSTGGTVSGTGGTTTVTCPTTFTATTGGYVLAPAHGGTCFHGYAYNFVDTNGTTITPTATNTYASCGNTCPLSAMGSMPIANAANSYAVYAGIGFNINQDQAGGTAMPTLTPTGTGLTIQFTSTIGTGLALRAQISDGTNNWCYTITGASPVTIPYGSFNTKCYDSPPDGTAYAMGPINAFQLQVAGGPMAGNYNITLTSVVEN